MDKTILISGAGGNLGTAVVKILHEAGCHIYATVGSGGLPEDLRTKVKEARRINLLDEAATQTYIQELTALPSRLDAAVLLVGGYAAGDMAHTTADQIDQQIALNFKTAWFLVQPLMAYFKKRGGGQFILTGSGPGIDPNAAKTSVAYALAKSLVFRLAEIINETGKGKGIKASVIVPGTIDTPANRQAMPDADFSEWVQAADIGKTIAFLLSEPAQALRETVLKVYG